MSGELNQSDQSLALEKHYSTESIMRRWGLGEYIYIYLYKYIYTYFKNLKGACPKQKHVNRH